MLADFDLYFKANDFILTNIGERIPRASLPGDLSFVNVLFYALPSLLAYFIMTLFNHLIAYFGMKRLLVEVSDNDTNQDIIKYSALCFALLPFWPFGLASIAGLPLIISVFLKTLNKRNTRQDFFILVLYPFYSSFFLIGIFLIITLALYKLWHTYKKRTINQSYIIFTFLLGTIYMLVEWRTITNFIDPLFVSHRSEFSKALYGITKSLAKSYKNFYYGQYHAASLQSLVILPMSLFFILLSFKKSLRDWKILIQLTLACLLISLFYGFWGSSAAELMKEKILFLKMFNFSRFHFFHPVLWGVVFFFALKSAYSYKKIIFQLLVFFQVFFCFEQSDFWQNKTKQKVSFNDFYMLDEFEEMKKLNPNLLYKKYLTVGMHPAVAQYHQVATHGFYLVNYPLSYKTKFVKTLNSEINKNPSVRNYIVNWGSRLYGLSSELGKETLNTGTCQINNFKVGDGPLDINFLLSRCEIAGLATQLTYVSRSKNLFVYSL